jgi:hypothetical protein
MKLHNYDYHPAPAPRVVPADPRIVTPITSERLAHFKQQMTETMSSEIRDFYHLTSTTASELRSIWENTHDYDMMKAQLGPNGTYAHLRESHQTACTMLLDISKNMAKAAEECLEYYTPGTHKRRYLSKKVQRQLSVYLEMCRYINSLTSTTKEALQQYQYSADSRTMCAHLIGPIASTMEKYKHIHDTMEIPPPEFPLTHDNISCMDSHVPISGDLVLRIELWMQELRSIHTSLRHAMWKLKGEEKQRMGKKYRQHWQRVMATQPRKAYKQIFKKAPLSTASGSDATIDGAPPNMGTLCDPRTGN